MPWFPSLEVMRFTDPKACAPVLHSPACRANLSSGRRGGTPVDTDCFEISSAEEESQLVNSESGNKTN